MKITKTSLGIILLILSVVLISATYLSYTQFFSQSEFAATISSITLEKSDIENNFTIEITIKNIGKNNITNADLHIIFIKGNDIINSKIQSFSLQKNSETTFTSFFTDNTFQTGSVYKIIASIYLTNESLDSKTITKQY
jgi:hypothetical protein